MASSFSTKISLVPEDDQLGPSRRWHSHLLECRLRFSPAALGTVFANFANRVSRQVFEVILAGAPPQQFLRPNVVPDDRTSGTERRHGVNAFIRTAASPSGLGRL